MKNTEIPSTPMNKCKFKDGNHSKYSKNWNLEVELSNKMNKNREYTNAISDVINAHDFIALTWVLGIPRIIKIPMNGIRISHDKIKSNIIDLFLWKFNDKIVCKH